MTTQVSFVTDKSLKEMALEKARQDGITLKALLVNAMKSYVEGDISFGLQMTPALMELQKTEVDANLKKQASMAKRSRKSDLIDIR